MQFQIKNRFSGAVMFDQARLMSLLQYDAETGLFHWRHRAGSGGRISPGTVAGCNTPRGYVEIGIDGVVHRAHRLAFLYVTGAFPERGVDIDHINGVKSDNRWDNLRLASRSQNNVNSKARTDLPKGVRKDARSGRWIASITVNRRHRHIGVFDTAELAATAYLNTARAIYGDFVRVAN